MDQQMNATIADHGIPPEVWSILHEFLLGTNNPSLDLRQPHLKSTFARIYPYVIVAYAILMTAGIAGNAAVLVYIIRHRLFKDETYTFLLNHAVSDLVKGAVVLPISLYVLLVQNWVLGELLCSFLPMIQDIPLHTSTLTFVLLGWDRLRFVRNPARARFPTLVCTVGAWLTSGCLVLPYPIYITYIDLGKYFRMNIFQGVGLCAVNLADDMKEYMRWIFFLMYVGPLTIISYLFVSISRELQSTSAIVTFQSSFKERAIRPRTDSHSTTTDLRSSRSKLDRSSQYSRSSCSDCDHSQGVSVGGANGRAIYEQRAPPDPHHAPRLDVIRELRTQKFLVGVTTAFGLCLCPLMILRLARMALIETYDNSGHFDLTYALFVWIAFAPTAITPIMFAAWQISGSRMERLCGYFRFSDSGNKFHRSCETVTTATGTPAAVPRASRRCPQQVAASSPPDDDASEAGSSA